MNWLENSNELSLRHYYYVFFLTFCYDCVRCYLLSIIHHFMMLQMVLLVLLLLGVVLAHVLFFFLFFLTQAGVVQATSVPFGLAIMVVVLFSVFHVKTILPSGGQLFLILRQLPREDSSVQHWWRRLARGGGTSIPPYHGPALVVEGSFQGTTSPHPRGASIYGPDSKWSFAHRT